MYRGVYLPIITAFLLLIGTVQGATNNHLRRAMELYKYGRWVDAKVELLKARDDIERGDYIGSQRVELYLALCALGLEEELALGRLNNFSTQYPHSLYSNQIDFRKGLLLSTSQEYAAARAELERVDYSKLSRADREDYDIRMGYIYFLDGNFASSKGYFERVPTGSEYWEHALYYMSYMDYASGELNFAKDGFTRLSLSDAYSSLAPYYLLQIEFQLGNYPYVIAQGETLMKNTNKSRATDIARTIAEAYFRIGEFDNAIKYITLYEELGGQMSREDSYIIGFSLYRITRYQAAIEHLKKASGADDELTQNASYHLADCYLRVGDKKGAIQAFAMASNDKYNKEIAEDALFNYGKLQFELGGGMFNEVINVLTRYINKYPKTSRTAEVKKLLVAAYYNSDSYDSAYKAIKEVKNPDSDIRAALQKITYFRALEAMNKGDYSTAKSNFRESESIGISPKYNALSRLWQGEINYYEGYYSAALTDFNTYLSLAPKGEHTYTSAHYSTAYALFKNGNESAAQRYFERFISMNPREDRLRTDAQNRIGDIQYSKRQFDEASKSYAKAAKSNGAEGDYARYQLSMVEGIKGFSDKKITGLKAIIKSKRGEYLDDAIYELGRTYMTLEKYKEAATTLEHFIATYPSSPHYAQALSDLGLSYLNLGDRSKAISHYDRAIKFAPQSSISKDALQGIREIYISEGDAKGYFDYASKMGLESDLGVVAKDSLSFTSAQRLYLHNDDKRAETALESYIKEYPQGYYLTDALFLLSDCHLRNGDKQKAVNSLILLSKKEDNQYTKRVLERLSQLTHELQNYPQAADAYRRLFDVSKSSSEKASAMEGYATCVIATKDNDRILKMADDVLSQVESGDKAILQARHAKATILRDNGEWTEAVKLYQELSKEPKSAVGAEASYYLIDNAHRTGELERAEKMIFELSDSGGVQPYWLARAFMTLGDIYVVRGDNFQARATYQSIVDGYGTSDDGIIEEAKSRIEKLKENEQ